jgi:hypothetical protein
MSTHKKFRRYEQFGLRAVLTSQFSIQVLAAILGQVSSHVAGFIVL